MLAQTEAFLNRMHKTEGQTVRTSVTEFVTEQQLDLPDRPRSTDRLKPLDLFSKSSTPGAGKADIVAEIRGRRVEVEHARTQREKRRRRAMQREADLLQIAEDEKRRTLQLNNVMKRSEQERRIATQLVQTRHEESVIRENRAFREKQHRDRRRRDFADALEREAKHAEIVRHENARQIQQEKDRFEELRQARETKRMEMVNESVRSVVVQIVELASKCAGLRTVTGKGVPLGKYREWKKLVMTDAPLYPGSSADVPIMGGVDEDPAATAILDSADFEDYHQVGNDWNELATDPEPPTPEPETEEAAADGEPAPVPQTAFPPGLNRVLGHVLDHISKVVDPPAVPPAPPSFAPAKLRVAVVGKSFCGKGAALKTFADSNDAVVISPEELIVSAVSAYQASVKEEPTADAGEAGEAGEDAAEGAAQPAGEAAAEGDGEGEGESEAATDDAPAAADAAAAAESTTGAPETADSTPPTTDADTAGAGEAAAEAAAEGGAADADAASATGAAPAEAEPDVAEVAVDPAELVEARRVEIGKEICEWMRSGDPVPEVLVAELIAMAVAACPSEKGWVLNDFPLSLSQAKLLEKVLTGRDENWARMNERWESTLAPLASDEVPPPPEDPPCGLDAVIHLDINNESCITRALGRRLDPETSIMYHIEGLGYPKLPEVPPADAEIAEGDEGSEVIGLHARLQQVDDDANDQVQLQRRMEIWQRDGVAALGWYQDTFGIVNTVQCDLTDEAGLAKELVDAIDDVARGEERAVQAVIDAQMGVDEAARVFEDEVAAEITAQQETETAISEELAKDVAEAARLAEETAALEAAEAAAGGKGKKKDKGKKGKGGGEPEMPEGADLEALIQSEQKGDNADAVAAVVVPAAGEQGYSYVSDELEPDLEMARWVLLSWKSLEAHYIKTIQSASRGLRFTRDDLIAYLHQTKLDYAKFLTRPDTKQEFVAQWQQAYNDMPQDMRDDPDTKAELHKRADELQHTLWDICTTREDEAEKEHQGIQNDGFIHNVVAVVTNQHINMLQAELDRYTDTTSHLTDYYNRLRGDDLSEDVPAVVTLPEIELFAAGSEDPDGRPVSAPEVEDDLTKPTIEKCTTGKDGNLAQVDGIVEQALGEIPERENPADVRARKAAEEAAQAEKDAKAKEKAKKPKKGEPVVEDLPPPSAEELEALEAAKKKEETGESLNDELYSALTVEDARLKARVELLKRSVVSVIEDVWSKAETLWGHMSLCAKHRNQAETESIVKMIEDIKVGIESEERLLCELVLHGEDYFVNESVYMFEPPKPSPQQEPTREDLHPSEFTINQLAELTAQFAVVAPGHTMPVRNFIGLLHGLSAVSVGSGLLPEAWLNLDVARVEAVAAQIANGSYVDWRSFVVGAMLLAPPTEAEALSAAAEVVAAADEAGAISSDAFAACKFWFDKDCAANEFDRCGAAKRLLHRLVSPADSDAASAKSLVQWLLRMESSVDALRLALAVSRGATDSTLPGDAEIEQEELYATLHRGATEAPPSTSSRSRSNPTGREALFVLWQLPGPKTVDSLLGGDDAPHALADFVARHFGLIDLNACIAL